MLLQTVDHAFLRALCLIKRCEAEKLCLTARHEAGHPYGHSRMAHTSRVYSSSAWVSSTCICGLGHGRAESLPTLSNTAPSQRVGCALPRSKLSRNRAQSGQDSMHTPIVLLEKECLLSRLERNWCSCVANFNC